MRKEHKISVIFTWLRDHLMWDGLALAFIIGLGWFLIGWYQKGNFLITGYQDWIYHAFRIKSLSEHGLVSWDHIWSNGINYWRLYQYVPHYLILWTSHFLHYSITKTMLWFAIVAFITTRVSMYIILRRVHVQIFPAFLATIVSFAFAQQWVALSDFSLFLPMMVVPIIIGIWIKSFEKPHFLIIFSALSGISFMLHPVLGISLFLLLIFTIPFYQPHLSTFRIIKLLATFIVTSTPFWVEYLFVGYSFINPIYASAQILRDTVINQNFGLSVVFLIIIAISWIINIVQTNKIWRWSKLLLLFCSLYILFILIGQGGNLPSFVNRMQLSRAITLIGILLPFCFATSFQRILRIYSSRFTYTLLMVSLAFFVTHSINLATLYSGQPSSSIINPVAVFFERNNLPSGSVFFQNVAEASYFAPLKIRFATSYNEHLEPHPLSQRFRNLLRNDLSYTGVTDKQKDLINAYSHVLGVEYIFLEDSSPLTSGLSASTSSQAIFRKETTLVTKNDLWSVLHNTTSIANAYVGSKNNPQQSGLVTFSAIPKPTLYASSFQPWDDAILKLASGLTTQQLAPLPLDFLSTNILTVHVASASAQTVSNRFLLITQSYDQNWQVVNHPEIVIRPTSLRFMYIELPNTFSDSTITLRNDWPTWHWPIQAFGPLAAILITGGVLWHSRRHHHEKKP
jgi:hypothetical protein